MSRKILLRAKGLVSFAWKEGIGQLSINKILNTILVKWDIFLIFCPDLAPEISKNYENYASNKKVEETTKLNKYVQLFDVYLQTLIARLHNGTKEMLVTAIFWYWQYEILH